MPKLEATPADAPPQFRAEEANAWACGYDAGVIEAIAACAKLVESLPIVGDMSDPFGACEINRKRAADAIREQNNTSK